VRLSGSFPDNALDSWALSLQVSAPERALLEWIDVTPNVRLFSSELVGTLDGLNTLRPCRQQALLGVYRSVRTKQAFLVLSSSTLPAQLRPEIGTCGLKIQWLSGFQSSFL